RRGAEPGTRPVLRRLLHHAPLARTRLPHTADASARRLPAGGLLAALAAVASGLRPDRRGLVGDLPARHVGGRTENGSACGAECRGARAVFLPRLPARPPAPGYRGRALGPTHLLRRGAAARDPEPRYRRGPGAARDLTQTGRNA